MASVARPVLRACEERVEFLPGLQLALGVEFQRKEIEAFDGLHTIPRVG